jgi:NAD(P)-dependent dehydrogenase (short-subunit alcohol dehydrogenase family)
MSDEQPPEGTGREHPAPPFPEQPIDPPGIEGRMHPPPQYEAPTYRPAGKLEGRVALITGGDSGIARAVALLFAREGADVALGAEEASDADDVRDFGAETPLGRPAQPEEIAPAYVYFASNADSSYVTGQVLTPLGGETRAG